LVLLLAAIGSIAGSGPLSQFLLNHGYLDWAQCVSDWVFQAAGLGLVVCFVIPIVLGLRRGRRHNPRRPGYVMLLSGYAGPRQRLVCVSGAAMPLNIGERRRECQRARFQRLLRQKVCVYVLLPWLFGGMLCLGMTLGSLHSLWPTLDLQQWWVITLGLASWMALLFPVLSVFARILIHRKGPRRAVRFLFPEAMEDMASSVDKVCYRLIGLRQVIREVSALRETH
jgi:hypothetical protein